MRNHTHTPWGMSDTCSPLANGIELHTTPSHGGFWLSSTRLAEMPARYTKVDDKYCPLNWFEEDCEWALVALSFPELFSPEALATAQEMYEQGWCNSVIAPEFRQKGGDHIA